MLRALEECTEEALGGSSWAARLDDDFLNNLGRYRKYNFGSLRDLLRVIRNKHNHFREMPPSLQQSLGPLPDGFLGCAHYLPAMCKPTSKNPILDVDMHAQTSSLVKHQCIEAAG